MNDKWRMYGLVPYNISPIQQGIQYGHAVQEYNNRIHDAQTRGINKKAFNEWRLECKTFIILNGGTTNKDENNLGSLNMHATTLLGMGVPYATFYEPDLGDQLTAVVFLVDEKVYNKKDYPDYEGLRIQRGQFIDPMEPQYTEWKVATFGSVEEADRVIAMREFVRQFRLA